MSSHIKKPKNVPSLAALLRALDTLTAGDVVLLELQRPGPNYDAGRDESGQWGMVPVEWSRVDRDALRVASAEGVTVIEPAGNGFQDLDAPEYEGRFTEVDSGALMVGAANPPGGEYGPPREAMSYSNFGTRVDLQGYGAAVVTAGYGDLWGAAGTPDRYSAQFGGTSAASPQVAGVAVLVASLLRRSTTYLMPDQMRDLLARTLFGGSAEKGNASR
jgi:subtilisin family serine protease